MHEFEMIARYLAPLSGAGALRLGDDAACLRVPPGKELVITKDALVEGVHFFAADAPGDIARKLLRVNLSDLAAKGALPYGYLMAWMLPEPLAKSAEFGAWVEGFTTALAADQAEYGITLLGGDTTRTHGPLCLSLTALGLVDTGAMLTRSGAQAGDAVYLTGTLGDAALGLQSRLHNLPPELTASSRAYLESRYLHPLPRVRLGAKLAGIAHAAMDVSDGLLQDAGHLARASGLGITLDDASLPLSAAAAEACTIWPDGRDAILSGGDDYEILFTAPVAAEEHLMELAAASDTPITRIGSVHAGEGVMIRGADGAPLPVTSRGWQHF